MAILRRRFFFWLLKAYVKKWGAFIVLSFFIGLILFFLLLKFAPSFIRLIPFGRKTIIGMTGAYTVDNLPQEVTEKIARGLTAIKENGDVVPDVASSWEIRDKGKKYIFHLRKGLTFSDGFPVTSQSIAYDFAGVTIDRPDSNTIVFSLKDVYAPFLVTVARPIYRNGYIGIGDYTINNIELNGNFVKSLQLLSRHNRLKTEIVVFYSSSDALKVAFALGEITNAIGLIDTRLHTTSFDTFPNVKTQRVVNHKQLVTLFYNTTDGVISDKKLRNGLSYALPDSFAEGERVYQPYPPKSKYYAAEYADRSQDLNHAQLLLSSSIESSSNSALPLFHMKTLTKYKKTADEIATAWKRIHVQVKIEEVDSIPEDYQLFLGDFNMPKDPDQYSLWHSNQQNNITKFKNLRIDKLLEDGRKTIDPDERIKIYTDFQKYLIDESPASFLYFPYEYELIRK